MKHFLGQNCLGLEVLLNKFFWTQDCLRSDKGVALFLEMFYNSRHFVIIVMDKILLEFGAQGCLHDSQFDRAQYDLNGFEPRVHSSILVLGELREHFAGIVDFELLPYESAQGLPFSGGRPSLVSCVDDLSELVELYGQRSTRFNLALNGGLNMSSEEADVGARDRDSELWKALTLLQSSGETNGVKNCVTILRDELLTVVKEFFPELATIASCIKFTVDGVDEVLRAYEDAFANYDNVVILAQHSKPEFLKHLKEYASRMIVFPFIGCAVGNLNDCRRHYSFVERSWSTRYLCGNCRDSLDEREDDLHALLDMGVRGFKFARGGVSLDTRDVKDLIEPYFSKGTK